VLKIRFEWDHNLPEYDPDVHDPEKVFAFLCYRGVHYAKWVYLDINMGNWKLFNPRQKSN